MGFFGAIKLWRAKHDLERYDSVGFIPRILETVEDHKGTESSSKIEDIALNKLLAMKMGKTPEDRLAYAQAVAIFPQGSHRAIVQLTALSSESSTLQLASLFDFAKGGLTHEIVMVIATRRDTAVPQALRHICARSAPRELEEAYKYAFTSLCRWGTDEALDVVAEIFYKNANLLRESICRFVEARIPQKPEGPVQVKRLLQAITDPKKLVPSLQDPRANYSLSLLFHSLDKAVKGAGIVDLITVFDAAKEEAAAPSKTVEARARAFV